jgi:arsenate reductase
MAEGFARALAVEGAGVSSAGIDPHGQNPRAIAAMEEVGIDISGQQSTRLNDAMLASTDLVVTVCGDADEQCPLLPPGTRKVHWPLADPARARGSEEEIAAEFRSVRDEIRGRVETLLREHRLLDSGAAAGTTPEPRMEDE